MEIFDLLQELPPYLSVRYRGLVYECSPALLCSGSTVRISYISGPFETCLHDRIKDQEELKEAIEYWAGGLRGKSEFHVGKAWIHKPHGKRP